KGEFSRIGTAPGSPSAIIGYRIVRGGEDAEGVGGFGIDRPIEGIVDAFPDHVVDEGFLPLLVGVFVDEVAPQVLGMGVGLVGPIHVAAVFADGDGVSLGLQVSEMFMPS